MARRGSLIAYVRAHATLDQPLVPASWHVVQEDSGWSTIFPLGRPGVSFQARLMIRRTGFTPHRGLFVCVGAPAVLQALIDRIASDGLPWTLAWSDLASFRADANAAVTTLRSEWPSAEVIGGLVRLLLRIRHDDDGEGGPT